MLTMEINIKTIQQINKFEYPNDLVKIFNKLNHLNYKCIIVGGYVRDFFLEKTSKDIDIEVYGLEHIQELCYLLKEFGDIHEVGKSFGVCKLQLANYDLDFSMPRIDNKTSKGHQGFTIETKKNLDFKIAASRRDFTINSMGYDTLNNKLLDPYNAKIDLDNKLLKIVDKYSFIEDPLRVFRAMSMIARFELNVEKATQQLCIVMVKKNMLQELSKERIYTEFEKLFLDSIRPSLGLVFLYSIGTCKVFFNCILNASLWKKTLLYLDEFTQIKIKKQLTTNKTNMKLSLVLLCYHFEEKNRIHFLQMITNETKLHQEIFNITKCSKILEKKNDTYTLKKIATEVKFEELFIVMDALGLNAKYIKKEVKDLDIINKKIPNLLQGKDLILLGLKPSPLFSQVLDEVYEAQLHSKLKTKKEALNFVKSLNYLSL